MEFVKAHGTGNDFVLLPDLADDMTLTADLTRRLCAPHLGLGADGVIRIAPPRSGTDADVFMDYRNADGSIAEMCGNGVRTVAKYALDRELVEGNTISVDTRAGVKAVQVVQRDAEGRVHLVRVDMGVPAPGERTSITVDAPDGPESYEVATVSMGNPHAVLVTDDVATAPVTTIGPLIERHPAFPNGANVEFIAVRGKDQITGRIWERGVGETMASGSGASAMAVGAWMRGLTGRTCQVTLPGGTLDIDWSSERLYVTGPAVEVASGTIDPSWMTAEMGVTA